MLCWFDSRSLGQLLLQQHVVLAQTCLPVRNYALATIVGCELGKFVDYICSAVSPHSWLYRGLGFLVVVWSLKQYVTHAGQLCCCSDGLYLFGALIKISSVES